MCGICGYIGSGNEKIAKQMADAIYHRGPDEEGIWQEEEVTLCSRRLCIVDIANGKQPMQSPDKQVSLIWNGEIYNHRKLRRELEQEGCTFHSTHSDTETLLQLYLRDGASFVHKLNGMFAIAIWDKRERKLLLYRDRMGVKPLYYYYYPGKCFVFSSEIKSILLYPGCEKRIHDAALYEYFSYKNIHAPQTAFQDIWEVMPGQMLQWKEDSLKSEHYWDVGDYFAKEQIPFDPVLAEEKWIPEITQQLLFLIQDAVKIRLEADVEAGSFLSGGLDSSLVSALAARQQPGLKCFTLGHKVQQAREYDKQADVDHAVQLAAQMGMQHMIHSITAQDVIEQMENIVTCFDQPFSGAVSTYFMSERMSRQVKTALSGDG
ncbi:MAG: asparagine synthase (glutamine-hydrolyzing), partial [Clostridiaceae bacterium]|nr:asparagine synthase (glutamine-hydrolyzing) [Clostridiaceae bacterium]